MRSEKHFFAEQGVAAVAGADAPDQLFFGEMQDVAPFGIQVTDRVQPGNEIFRAAQPFERLFSGAGHDHHADDHVQAVGDLDADATVGRIHRPHQVRDHIHGAVAHGAIEQRSHSGLGFFRGHPVVRGTGVVFLAGADEGNLFGAGHVGRIAAMQVAVREGVLVERKEDIFGQRLLQQPAILRLGAIAPDDLFWFGQRGSFFDPSFQRCGHGASDE